MIIGQIPEATTSELPLSSGEREVLCIEPTNKMSCYITSVCPLVAPHFLFICSSLILRKNISQVLSWAFTGNRAKANRWIVAANLLLQLFRAYNCYLSLSKGMSFHSEWVVLLTLLLNGTFPSWLNSSCISLRHSPTLSPHLSLLCGFLHLSLALFPSNVTKLNWSFNTEQSEQQMIYSELNSFTVMDEVNERKDFKKQTALCDPNEEDYR